MLTEGRELASNSHFEGMISSFALPMTVAADSWVVVLSQGFACFGIDHSHRQLRMTE
jgi:hypothetical protein